MRGGQKHHKSAGKQQGQARRFAVTCMCLSTMHQVHGSGPDNVNANGFSRTLVDSAAVGIGTGNFNSRCQTHFRELISPLVKMPAILFPPGNLRSIAEAIVFFD